MNRDFWVWETQEPIRRRSVEGLFTGAAPLLLIGMLVDPTEYGASRSSILLALGLAGGVGGLIVGALLALFRWRVLAGLVVSVAGTVGSYIVLSLLGDGWPFGMSVFLGVSIGIAYAGVHWKYDRPK